MEPQQPAPQASLAQPPAAGGPAAATAAGAARYKVEHETRYAYTAPVSQSWQLARLTPRRTLRWQRVLSHSVEIEPVPDERIDVVDSFGNEVTHFGLHGAHRLLVVTMRCVVEVDARPAVPGPGPVAEGAAWPSQPPGRLAWEKVRDALRQAAAEPQAGDALLAAAGMSEPTPLVPLSEAARVYAGPSLPPGRDWLAAVTDLMHRIHADFEFEPGATTVSTSVDEVLHQRSGVCQDFAHLMLACLRGHGLPARYVSGYLLTEPPPGMPRLMGVDASHAWVAAYSPAYGWIEFDPTNDTLADRRYITLAWGADFGDVVPLRGVILGGGGSQGMDVAVSVIPQQE